MKRIILILVLILGGWFYFVTDSNELVNDYYDAVNKKFFSKDYLDSDKYIYNTFTVAQEESNELRDEVVRDIISGKVNISNRDDMLVLYSNILDVNERNEVGISYLDDYIDSIMSSKDIVEFINNSMVVEKELGVDIFTRMVVDNDFVDNTKNIIYLYPITFAFGSTGDYFVDDNYMAYKAYIKRAIINLLEKYGMSKNEARLVSSEVINFYSDISSDSKLSDSYEEVDSYYNVVDKKYLSDIYSNIDMDKYFSFNGVDDVKYSLVDEGQYKKINEYLDNKYLMIWKKCVLVKILSSYANYLDMGYRDIVTDLNNSLTGSNDSQELEEDAISLVGSVFSNDIDKIYESRVIDEDNKTYLYNLFMDIKNYFRKMLSNNKWLSDETKSRALEKLEVMKVYIGVYDNIEYDIDISGNSLVENIISINKYNHNEELVRLKNNSDKKVMSEIQVNAYYNPMTNAVYIPSSVMYLLNDDNSYYENLGTIGMIIAHEITHGFDYNGSKFDSKGNFNNWWNDDDRDNFLKLKESVSEYYSKIEVIDGRYINGDLTVNENIADMGALKVITGVALDNGASNKELKDMYLAFAKFWKCQVRDEYAKLLLLNDSHSPNKYRVNAVLPLLDEFYKVYRVYPWNDMYITKDNRVSVW